MGKVEPYNCWDGVVNGGPGVEEFENILNILDFPMESLEGDGFIGDWDASKSQYFGPIPSDVLIGPPTIATGPPLVLLPASSAPIDTKPELKQHLSYQSEGTSSSFVLRPNKCTNIKEQGLFNTQSPVSVLESNGSSSAHKIPLINSCISKRTRTARARPSGLSPWLSISPLFDARQSFNARKSRERRTKLCQLSVAKKTTTEDSSDFTDSPNGASRRPGVAKKCTHCEVTKTPQWREGPMGPRTLCNACGVRYRSGRLFPEYRPALSPSFSPALHSNSHKKVLEMRGTARIREVTKIEEHSSVSPRVEFVPLSSNLFDHMC